MAAMASCNSACTVAGMSGVGVGVAVGMDSCTAASTVAGMSGVAVGGVLVQAIAASDNMTVISSRLMLFLGMLSIIYPEFYHLLIVPCNYGV